MTMDSLGNQMSVKVKRMKFKRIFGHQFATVVVKKKITLKCACSLFKPPFTGTEPIELSVPSSVNGPWLRAGRP